MRVLLVHSVAEVNLAGRPAVTSEIVHLGLSSISSVLKSSGHTTALAVISRQEDDCGVATVRKACRELAPEAVFYTAVSTQYAYVAEVAGLVRALAPGAFHLVGGPHATVVPEEVIRGPFDALCRGEGELPSLEVLAQLSDGQWPSGIPNLWIRRPDGSIDRNPLRPHLADLDALPPADLAMWGPWYVRAPTLFPLLLGRGCPFACTYCSNAVFRSLAPGRYVRFRSPASVVGELGARLSEFPGVSRCYLEVETIGANVLWLKELCRELSAFNARRPEPVAFGCNYRVSKRSLDESVFAALESAHVDSIDIGLETGNERLRKNVLRRGYTNAELMKAVSLARRHGMAVTLYNMIGLPGETHAHHMETVETNRLIKPDHHYTSIFYPYPGTELHDYCTRLGLISTEHEPMKERDKAAIKQKKYPGWLVGLDYFLFDIRIYCGTRPMFSLLRGALFRLLSRVKPLRSAAGAAARIWARLGALGQHRA